MRVVVLKKALRSAVEDFDLLVCAARSETSRIWMELDAVYHACVVGKLLDLLSAVCNVPKSDCLVI